MAIGLVDLTPNAVSSVYFYYHPDAADYSPGWPACSSKWNGRGSRAASTSTSVMGSRAAHRRPTNRSSARTNCCSIGRNWMRSRCGFRERLEIRVRPARRAERSAGGGARHERNLTTSPNIDAPRRWREILPPRWGKSVCVGVLRWLALADSLHHRLILGNPVEEAHRCRKPSRGHRPSHVHLPEAVQQIGQQLLFPRDDAGQFPDVRAARGIIDLMQERLRALHEEE